MNEHYKNIIIEDLAKNSIKSIYYYNMNYSLRNAIETNNAINAYIERLPNWPYMGRSIPELSNARFREIIYRKSRRSGYRIMYYLSQYTKTIYVFNVMNCRKDFNRILKSNNYFNKYLNF